MFFSFLWNFKVCNSESFTVFFVLVRFAHAKYSLCEICLSKVKAIYLLRKCDIISRCDIAIYSPLANVVESTKVFHLWAKAKYSLCEICISKVKAIYLLCKCDIDKRNLSAICLPLANVVESTLHINPHAAQFAAYRAASISRFWISRLWRGM